MTYVTMTYPTINRLFQLGVTRSERFSCFIFRDLEVLSAKIPKK